MLLTRGVLYTAMTRARELLILVGDDQVVARMAANDRQQRRYSGLRARCPGPPQNRRRTMSLRKQLLNLLFPPPMPLL